VIPRPRGAAEIRFFEKDTSTMTSQRAGCPRRAAPAGRRRTHPPHLIQAAHHLPRGERAKGLQRIGLIGGSSPLRGNGTRSPFVKETGRCLRSPRANATGFATAYSKGRSTAAARCPPSRAKPQAPHIRGHHCGAAGRPPSIAPPPNPGSSETSLWQGLARTAKRLRRRAEKLAGKMKT